MSVNDEQQFRDPHFDNAVNGGPRWTGAGPVTAWTIDDGWLSAAKRIRSPNYDERPAGVGIDLLVIHNISLPPGQFGGPWVEALFTNQLDTTAHPFFEQLKGLEVSAHLFIRRDGSVFQFVPFTQRAWHAGQSRFGERTRCNDFSIGIELEGTDDILYTDEQYDSLVAATKAIMANYPAIEPSRIVGHNDIAPVRKTDPGLSFNWLDYLRRVMV